MPIELDAVMADSHFVEIACCFGLQTIHLQSICRHSVETIFYKMPIPASPR